MKKLLLAIAFVMSVITLSAQGMGGGPGGGGPGGGGPGGDGSGKLMGLFDGKKGKLDKFGKKPPKAPDQNYKRRTLITVPKLYAYAVGITPGDSVVYLSDILILNNARLTKHTKFLVNRNDYSAQFKDYLSKNYNDKLRTCALIYNKSYSGINKDYDKVMKRFEKKKYLVRIIYQTAFQFVVPSPDE